MQGIPYCLTQVATGGTVVIPKGTWALASTVNVSNNGITIQVQGTIQPSANVPVFNFTGTGQTLDGMGVGVVNGRASQDGRTANCINVSGITGLTIKNLTITNCGFYGVFLDGSVTANSNFTLINSRITASKADAMFSQGGLTNQEIGGGYFDCSAATFSLTHCLGVHSAYDNNPAHYGTVTQVNWHDNVVICLILNDCGEIGGFVIATPVPAASLPTKFYSSHNRWNCNASGSGFGLSLSEAADVDIDGDIADAGGFAGTCRFEFYGVAGGAARGLQYINAPATGTNALIIENGTQNFTVSDGVFNGGIAVTTGDPLFALSNQCGLTFTGNHLILPSSYGTGSGVFSIPAEPGGIESVRYQYQCKNTSLLKLAHRTGTRWSISSTVIARRWKVTRFVEGNTARNINWLYDNQNSTCSWTRPWLSIICCSPEYGKFNLTTNLTNLIYNNLGFPSKRS